MLPCWVGSHLSPRAVAPLLGRLRRVDARRSEEAHSSFGVLDYVATELEAHRNSQRPLYQVTSCVMDDNLEALTLVVGISP